MNFITLFDCVSAELCLIQGSVQFRGAASFLHASKLHNTLEVWAGSECRCFAPRPVNQSAVWLMEVFNSMSSVMHTVMRAPAPAADAVCVCVWHIDAQYSSITWKRHPVNNGKRDVKLKSLCFPSEINFFKRSNVSLWQNMTKIFLYRDFTV